VADISRGSVGTLPYSSHTLPEGAVCDDHPNRQAVARIQGETDSFGCEFGDYCQECLDKLREYRRSPEARTGVCDWCDTEATDLRDARDYDEGMGGPVYRVCGGCIKRRNDEASEELARYDNDWGDDYD